MTALVAIDPGFTRIARSRTRWVDRSAFARFENRVLTLCDYVGETLSQADEVVVEKPTVYPTHAPGALVVSPNDIVDLAFAAGLVSGRFGCPVTEVLAQDWKLQMQKPVCHNRMLKVLTDAERRHLPAGSEAKVVAAVRELGVTGRCPSYRWIGVDVLDAVALGLVYLGRLNLGGHL